MNRGLSILRAGEQDKGHWDGKLKILVYSSRRKLSFMAICAS